MDSSPVQFLAQTTVDSLGQPIVWPQGGTAEITVLSVETAPGQEIPWHRHPVPLVGYIVSGEVTVYQVTGERRTVRAGEVSLESVGVVHRGVNEGTLPCRMILFVVGQKGVDFTEMV